MKPIEELNSQLMQTSVKSIGSNKIRAIIRQHNFAAGTVDIDKKEYVNVPRSAKNIFRMFGGGLGLNDEILNIILPFFSIEKIIIPYQGNILVTTPGKWRKLGIVSPFCDQKVDKQVILTLKLISMDKTDNYSNTSSGSVIKQMNLF